MTQTDHRGRKDAPSIGGDVYRVLHKNLGLQVYVQDIIAQTGLSKPQILGALQGLRSRRGLDIRTVVPGAVYALASERVKAPEGPSPAPVPAAKTGRRMFEEIGPMKDGTLIIQAEDGSLYKATEL